MLTEIAATDSCRSFPDGRKAARPGKSVQRRKRRLRLAVRLSQCVGRAHPQGAYRVHRGPARQPDVAAVQHDYGSGLGEHRCGGATDSAGEVIARQSALPEQPPGLLPRLDEQGQWSLFGADRCFLVRGIGPRQWRMVHVGGQSLVNVAACDLSTDCSTKLLESVNARTLL